VSRPNKLNDGLFFVGVFFLLESVCPFLHADKCRTICEGEGQRFYSSWYDCHTIPDASICRQSSAGGGSAGASAPTYDAQQQMMMQMAQMGGAALGNALHDAMFGNPQQEAALRAQQAAESERIRLEIEAREAREKQAREERLRRINALLYGDGDGGLAMKNVTAEAPLEIKSGTRFFGIDANPSSGTVSTELTLKGGESVESYAARDPSVAFNEAVYLAMKATAMSNPQDSKILLESSYQAVIGEPVNLEIPKDVAGKPVSETQMSAVQQIQKSYQDSQQERREDQAKLDAAKYKQQIAEKVLKQAEQKAATAPAPPAEGQPPAPDQAQIDAQKMLEEAKKLDEHMNHELEQAKKNLEAADERMKAAEKQAHQYVGKLAEAKP
jgi:hypothetical protein